MGKIHYSKILVSKGNGNYSKSEDQTEGPKKHNVLLSIHHIGYIPDDLKSLVPCQISPA